MTPQDPLTDTATKLATSDNYTVAGVLAAVAFLAITGFAWMLWAYMRQRDKDERRYQKFTETMIPILTQFKDTTAELKELVRTVLRRQGEGGHA